MPTEFQKVMDKKLSNIANTYAFLDDILIVTKGNPISSKFESKIFIANKFGENLLIANYKDDQTLQKIIDLVKNPTKSKIKSLDSPWRERFFAIIRWKRPIVSRWSTGYS